MNADGRPDPSSRLSESAGRNKHERCSFCGRERTQVEALVSGPGVYICDTCVDSAARIIASAQASDPDVPNQSG
jgi:hypothetical protein